MLFNMKKAAIILLFLSYQICLSQNSGWFWQNPLPQGNSLGNLQFVNSNTAFCLSYDKILKSTDAGLSWQMISSGQTQNNSSLFFVDANTGYLLCDTGKVLKTTNSGNTWNVVSDLQSKISRFIYFANNVTGYALSSNSYRDYDGTKFFRTTNSASSWNLIFADTVARLVSVSFPQNDTGYAIGYYGPYYTVKIMKTTNAGVSWDSIPQTFMTVVTGVSFLNSNTGFLFGDGSGHGSASKTTNGGINWSYQSIPSGYCSNLQFFDFNNGLAVDNSYGIVKTTNGGANWNVLSYVNESNQGIYSMKFLSPSTGYFVGLGGRIMKSTNGGLNWLYLSNGLHNDLWSMKFIEGNIAYAVGDNTMLKSTDGGTSWFKLTNDSATYFGGICVDFVNAQTGFVGGMLSFRKTTNGGANWQTVYGVQQGILNDVFFSSINTGYVITKYGQTYKTTNTGINWNLLPFPGPYPYSTFFDFIYFINDLTGFVGGGLADFGAISKTTDGGNSWDTTRTFNSAWLNDLVFINANTGFAAGYYLSGGTILKSTDGGATWNNKIIIPDGFFNSIHFADANTGYSCLQNGKIAKTTDGGESWNIYPTETNNELWSVHFLNSETGFVAGFGGTILKTTTGGMPIGMQPISNETPKLFLLQQNYPNPFNPVTKINFSLPNPSEGGAMNTKLIVFDILGREVSTLVNEKLQPGDYEVKWDASKFASGVYFYQLTTDGFSLTKKMVLIK
jgi:photosystem II stability/assembly factor-like uncharacterized protein